MSPAVPIVGQKYVYISSYLTTNVACKCTGQLQFLTMVGHGSPAICPHCKWQYVVVKQEVGGKMEDVIVALPPETVN